MNYLYLPVKNAFNCWAIPDEAVVDVRGDDDDAFMVVCGHRSSKNKKERNRVIRNCQSLKETSAKILLLLLVNQRKE